MNEFDRLHLDNNPLDSHRWLNRLFICIYTDESEIPIKKELSHEDLGNLLQDCRLNVSSDSPVEIDLKQHFIEECFIYQHPLSSSMRQKMKINSKSASLPVKKSASLPHRIVNQKSKTISLPKMDHWFLIIQLKGGMGFWSLEKTWSGIFAQFSDHCSITAVKYLIFSRLRIGDDQQFSTKYKQKIKELRKFKVEEYETMGQVFGWLYDSRQLDSDYHSLSRNCVLFCEQFWGE